MLELKKYSTEEIKAALNISKRQWDERRVELLEYWKFFFDYEIISEGTKVFYLIKEQYGEYEPLPRKLKRKEIEKYYCAETKEIIKEQPWNTGSNVARNIIASDRNKYAHSEDTMSGYACKVIRENFLPPLCETQWMRLSANRLKYLPLTEEQEKYLDELFMDNSKEGKARVEIEKFADSKSGYITEEELKEFLMNNVSSGYMSIMNSFRIKFGFQPIKVKKLVETIEFKDQGYEL